MPIFWSALEGLPNGPTKSGKVARYTVELRVEWAFERCIAWSPTRHIQDYLSV